MLLQLSHLLWIVVALLFIGNITILVFSSEQDANQDASRPLQETTSTDKHEPSFWQRWLRASILTKSQLETKPSRFDGQEIDAAYEESVISVMIDNFAAARQQHSGIRQASIVYEALVEGGITRLMLVFPYQETEKVGPVRSARDYFVGFAEEYGGMYVHAGGSPTAMKQLWASDRVYTLEEDERLEGEIFSFRDQRYNPPHNLFFDLLLVREEAEQRSWDTASDHQKWCFSDDVAGDLPARLSGRQVRQAGGAAVDEITLDFTLEPSPSYSVLFSYDDEQNLYKRFYYPSTAIPHTDQYDGLQVAPANIIVQIVPSSLIEDDEKERIRIGYLGSGKAFYYRNGKAWNGTWEKTSAREPTRFLDERGEPFCLNPGQTWVAVVDSERLVREN